MAGYGLIAGMIYLGSYILLKNGPEVARGVGAVLGDVVGAVEDALTKNGPRNNDNDDIEQTDKYCVYKLYEFEDNKVQYIGRTNNLERRRNEHRKNPKRWHLVFSRIDCYSSYNESKINEQIYIDYYKTLNRENKMNNQRNGVNKKSAFYRDKVIPYRQGLYFDETYVGGKEWD